MTSYNRVAAYHYSATTVVAAAANTSPSADVAFAAEIASLEAQVATLHNKAQELNKQGRVGEATVVYKQMAALDDRALGLQLARPRRPSAAASVEHQRAFPDYCSLQQPGATWVQAAEQRSASGAPLSAAQLRSRALSAVLGALLADAAACGVQWVYDTPHLAQLAATSSSGHLDFFDPPQCPFFDYPPGSPSPYGQQTLVLRRSLAAAGGLHCGRYAEDLFLAFGGDFGGYRDKSTKAFLRRFAAGALPPQTGCEGAPPL